MGERETLTRATKVNVLHTKRDTYALFKPSFCSLACMTCMITVDRVDVKRYCVVSL